MKKWRKENAEALCNEARGDMMLALEHLRKIGFLTPAQRSILLEIVFDLQHRILLAPTEGEVDAREDRQ